MISIKCDVKSLEKSRLGAIVGSIHLQFGQFAFPDQGWSDFVVRILGWWLEALGNLSGEATAELRFMDGPYVLSVSEIDDGLYGVECVAAALKRKVLWSGNVSRSEFRTQLITTAAQVASSCREKHWHSSDVEHLTEVLKRVADRWDAQSGQ